MENLGKKIKFLRMQKNLTQKQLAERAAMSANNLSLIETAKRDYLSLSINNLVKIAEGLGMALRIDFVDKNHTLTAEDFQAALQERNREIQLLNKLVESLQTQQECAQHYFNLGLHRALMFIAPPVADSEKEQAYDDAIRFLMKAVEIQAHFYEAWCLLGHIHLRKARKLLFQKTENHQAFLAEYKLGEHCYLKAAIIAPKHHRTLNNHINLLLVEYQSLKYHQPQLALTKLNEAKKYIDEQILLFPEYEPHFIYNLACIYANLGETEQAIDLLKYAYDERLLVYRPREREYILGDEDLFVLHDKPEFQQWLSDF